jgi:hypothetical protein
MVTFADNRYDASDAERPRDTARLADVFEAYGRDILKKIRQDEPEKFWLFVSGVVRMDEALGLGDDLSDDDLDFVVARVVAGLRQSAPRRTA